MYKYSLAKQPFGQIYTACTTDLYDMLPMEYHHFPTERPNEDLIAEEAADILSWNYAVYQQLPIGNDNLVRVERMKQPEEGASGELWFHAPSCYGDHLAIILFRLSALAFLIKIEKEETLRIKPYVFWVILAQNFAYLNGIMINFAKEVKAEMAKGTLLTANWHSKQMDRYIVTEVVHGWHEPAHVAAYHLMCTAAQPNLSQARLEEIGM